MGLCSIISPGAGPRRVAGEKSGDDMMDTTPSAKTDGKVAHVRNVGGVASGESSLGVHLGLERGAFGLVRVLVLLMLEVVVVRREAARRGVVMVRGGVSVRVRDTRR